MSIFVATSSFASYSSLPLELFNQEGLVVKINPTRRKITSDELLSSAKDCIGLIAGTEQYSKDVLSKMKNLKVISRLGVGIDNIDINEAKKLNIKVFTTQTSPSLAVAELTISLILNLDKKSNQKFPEKKCSKISKIFFGILFQKK